MPPSQETREPPWLARFFCEKILCGRFWPEALPGLWLSKGDRLGVLGIFLGFCSILSISLSIFYLLLKRLGFWALGFFSLLLAMFLNCFFSLQLSFSLRLFSPFGFFLSPAFLMAS
jgi:hypothetical protein